MENIIVVVMMVIASVVANPFLSANEVKKPKPGTEIANLADDVDDQDDTSEDSDVVMDDQTESK